MNQKKVRHCEAFFAAAIYPVVIPADCRRGSILALILCLLLFPLHVFSSDTTHPDTDLLTQAQSLYNQIPDKRQSYDTISQWKAISDLLEQAGIYNEMLIIAYDNQARYPEKYQAMKKYAEILYPADKDKKAGYLKTQADKLAGRSGMDSERIAIYRYIVKEYPGSASEAGIRYALGEIIEREKEPRRAEQEYNRGLQANPSPAIEEKLLVNLGKIYASENKIPEAIVAYQKYLTKYSGGADAEMVFMQLGMTYCMKQEKEKAKELFNRYLAAYPSGKYQKMITRMTQQIENPKGQP